MAADVPIYVTGPPGACKSALVNQIGGQMDYTIFDVRGSTTDPVDWRGVPDIEDGFTVFRPPDFLPRPDAGPCILFLDEMPNADQGVQKAMLELALDRRLGKYRLPEACRIVAAGNRVGDRAGSARLITSLGDRFQQIELEVDLGDWLAWAFAAGIDSVVISFLRWRPEYLSMFDPAKEISPSPRSWEFVSNLLPHWAPAIEYSGVCGLVGEAAGAEFIGFKKIHLSLPDPDSILMNPAAAVVPDDPATLYALCGALAGKASDNTAERLCQYADRLPPEFGVLLIRDSAARDPKGFVQTRAVQKWYSENSEIYG